MIIYRDSHMIRVIEEEGCHWSTRAREARSPSETTSHHQTRARGTGALSPFATRRLHDAHVCATFTPRRARPTDCSRADAMMRKRETLD